MTVKRWLVRFIDDFGFLGFLLSSIFNFDNDMLSCKHYINKTI